MLIRSKWLIILVGPNDTGKTTLQKKLIKLLSDDNRDIRLDCNCLFQITHSSLVRKLRTFSIGNRSIHEKLDEYESVEGYFSSHFCEADLCFISSHLVVGDINQMISQGHRRFYNVCGVFFSNSIARDAEGNANISDLPWDERLLAENEPTSDHTRWDEQLHRVAESIVRMLIERSKGW
jgi:energy-coupling factor transporter ATP-binding protein EcfA2